MNDDNGGSRPAQYWPAPLADSARQAPSGPPELVIPERRIGRTVVICVLVGVLVVAAVATVGAVMRGEENARAAGPPHTITIPASVDGYDRLTGSVADRTVESIRQGARDAGGESPAAASISDNATIAVYQNNNDDRRFVFIGISAGADPEMGKELRSHSASHEADEIFDGEGDFSNEHDFATGPFGGVLRCGDGTGDSVPTSICVWVDGSTVGMLLAPKTSDGALAGTTLDFRNAAEH